MFRSLNNYRKTLKNIIYFFLVFILAHMFKIAIPLELDTLKEISSVILVATVVELFILKPAILYIILLIGFTLSIIINHYFISFIDPLFKNLYIIFENIINYIMSIEDLNPKNELIFWVILIALVAIYAGIILFKNKNIYLLPPVYMGILIYYWYSFYDIAYFLLAIFFFTFFILLGLDKCSSGKTLISYSFLIVVLALLIPKTSASIKWYWLQNIAYDIFPGMEDMRSSSDYAKGSYNADSFDFATTGYQRNPTQLGGPIRESNTILMTVKADRPFYLRGNVRHIYTGNMWKSKKIPWERHFSGEDFSRISKEDRAKYFTKSSIEITNHMFSSTTLFSPHMASKVYLDGHYEIEIGPDGEIQYPKGIYSGDSYTIDIITPIPYDILSEFKDIDYKKESLDELSAYLQYPKSKITKSTMDLTNEIVKNKKTDYEKAVAIEKYLRENYTYTIEVEKPPKNRDFIDYFLFASKEGYCTYYATSMAIMLRLEGIPSRYIEGFVANNLVGDGIYEIKAKNAHAWVEAFIEPVGWMIFDPTPQYPAIPRLEGTSPIAIPSPDPEDKKLINIDHREELKDISISRDEIPVENMDQNVHIDLNKEERLDTIELGGLSENTIAIVLGTILSLVLLKFLIDILREKYKNIKIKKLPNEMRTIAQYNEILKIIENLGYPMKNGETHYEYANRIAYRFSFIEDKGIQEITDIFVKCKYGKIPISDEDVYEIEKFKENMENRAKKNRHKNTP